MKLWQHPRLAGALCALAVLVCAAAPAVFLATADAAALGRTAAVQDLYTAPVPSGDDYYLLRQLTERAAQSQTAYTPLPQGDAAQDRMLYVGARSDIGGMTASSVYRDTMDAVLQDLAGSGALAPAWAAWACDWAETGPYTDYDGTQYWLEMPYYATDSLGFITLKRFALDETGTLYTACSLTMDSRTGAVVDIWLSAPYDYFGGRAAQQAALEAAAEAALEGAATGEADVAAGSAEPSMPDETALHAFAEQAGLAALGDWAVPQDSLYPNALYSQNGAALITASLYPYTTMTGSVSGGETAHTRWVYSLTLQPCTAEELPRAVPENLPGTP